MKKFTTEIMVALAAASFATAGMAGGDKVGAGAGGSAGAHAGSAGANAGANAGGSAGAHASPQGQANSNGQFLTERERQFGQERAETRRSDRGNEKERASTAPGERKGQQPSTEITTESAGRSGASARTKTD